MTVERAQHPELDELAAFVDGRLAGDRRRRIIEHLADCPDCRDLFADAAQVVAEVDFAEEGEERKMDRRPLSGPWRRRLVLAAALAASLALILLTPKIVELVVGPPNTLAAVTSELVPRDGDPGRQLSTILAETWQSHDWPRQRSLAAVSSLRSEERSFQLGVRVVELEVALRSGHGQLAQRMTYRLENLLGEDLDSEQALYLYTSEQGIRGRLEAGADPRNLTSINSTAADLLAGESASDRENPADAFWFDLGLWSRAAQLAAEAGKADFFAQRSNRRRLKAFAERPLPAPVAGSLERLIQLSQQPTEHLPEIELQLEALITAAGGGEPAKTAR